MASHIERRKFLATLGGAAAWPLAARAQQTGVPLVGLLLSTQMDDRQVGAIRQGLRDAGYIEGRNVAIKYRSGDGRFDRLPALAAELVADAPAAIVVVSPAASLAAKAATDPFRSYLRSVLIRLISVSCPVSIVPVAMSRA